MRRWWWFVGFVPVGVFIGWLGTAIFPPEWFAVFIIAVTVAAIGILWWRERRIRAQFYASLAEIERLSKDG